MRRRRRPASEGRVADLPSPGGPPGAPLPAGIEARPGGSAGRAPGLLSSSLEEIARWEAGIVNRGTRRAPGGAPPRG